MWRLLVLVALVWANHHELPESSVAKDPNTRLILWGTRHGNRNPGQFVKQDPQTWGFEGANELTRFGKRQALGLGRELRKFVGDWVSENYLPEEVKYYSSSASRCQMTLQGAVAGFHRPREWGLWKYELNRWSPTPYTIDDPLLRMYAVEKCPGSDDAWRPISEDTLPELQEITHEKKTILDYIAKNTGWNASIADAADLADNLIVIKLSKAPYPDWIEHPTLPGYSKERLLYHIGKFAENHQIKCAEYGPCRHMMGGYWLKNILDALKKAAKDEGPKVIGYASHTEVTLALMKLLHIEKEELTTSAGFVVEFRLKPAPSVRLLNHDPHKTDLHVIYQAEYSDDLKKVADADGWIPLDDFVKAVEGEVIDDWQAECRVPPKKCDA